MSDNKDDNKEIKERERAIALKYHDSSELPKIIAKGSGEIARQIIELAKSNGIPVQRDDTLAELLSKIESGHSIPEESFRLVAEVLCFLYHTDKEWREQHPHLDDLLLEDGEDQE